MTLGNAEKYRNKKARETDRQRQMQTDDRTKERERETGRHRQKQTKKNIQRDRQFNPTFYLLKCQDLPRH